MPLECAGVEHEVLRWRRLFDHGNRNIYLPNGSSNLIAGHGRWGTWGIRDEEAHLRKGLRSAFFGPIGHKFTTG
jgi:hypothetical protein